jgi:hypothetical protein
MWDFVDLRKHLFQQAEKVLSDVDKVAFVREFEIKAWLIPAHKRRCQRAEPLSTDEARKLGMDSLLLVSRMREVLLNRRVTHASLSQSGANTNRSSPGYSNGSARAAAFLSATSQMPEESAILYEKIGAWVKNGCVFP